MTSAAATPPDQQVRDAIGAELDRSAFVEAGAGTGKSTTLVDRIVAMVDSAADPVSLRNIAAITFTEKAAGELHDKVRDALTKSAATDRTQQALHDVDVAVIGTIHSFAKAILREHVVAAGLPLGFEVVNRPGAAQARARRMVEVWDERLAPDDRQRLRDAGISLITLQDLSIGLDAARTRIDPARISPPELVDVETWASAVASELDQCITETLAGCSDLDDKLAQRIAGPLLELRDALTGADAAAVGELRSRWEEIRPKTFVLRSIGAKAAWPGEGGAKAVRDSLKEFEQPVKALLDAPLANTLRWAAAIAWEELERQQNARVAAGELEYDDLLLLCRELLRSNREVRRLVAERFRVVLVDEFQDTDPVQWEIIRLITSNPDDDDANPQPGRLIVVGDPKQAIYSFRGADIGTYLSAREHFPGHRYELTTSFRSVAPLVAWVNTVFSQLFVASTVQPEYLALQPYHAPSTQSPGPPVVVLRDPAEPAADAEDAEPATAERVRVRPQDLEPQLVAATILRAVDEAWQVTEPGPDRRTRHYQRGCDYRDIAVLVPTRTGVPDLLNAFDRLAIPYRSADPAIVLERPAVSGLVAALRVLDDPDDQLALWWTLKSPLFGCADDDLLRHRAAGGSWWLTRADGDGPYSGVEGALDVLARLRDRWLAPQPAAVLDALVKATRLRETLALVPRGEFDSDCVGMLQDHARRWQADGGVGLRDYLAAVDELTDKASRATLAEPDNRDDDAVRISTVHAAKGLEFPVVVLAGMATGRGTFTDVVGVRRDGGIEICAAGIKTAAYEEWKEQERAPREQAELLRLLYVACTRARDHLIVSVVGDGRARSAAIRDPVLASDAEQVDVVPVADSPAVDVAGWAFDSLPPDWDGQLEQARAASAVSWVSSPSRAGAVLDADRADEVPAGSDQPEPDDDGASAEPASVESSSAELSSAEAAARRARDGRPVGRALHAALDRLFSAIEPPGKAEIDAAVRRAVDEEGVAGDYADVHQRVRAALASNLATEVFAARRRWTELYLAAPQHNGEVRLIEGYADLVFENDDGLVLVDHKSDAVLSVEALAHYRAQLDGYAELLRRATGRSVVRQVLLHLPGETATVVELSEVATG